MTIDARRSGRTERAFPQDAIGALADLLDDLSEEGVRYCQWKSNEHLGAALAGRTDLDLLVDPDHAAPFGALVARHGLKRLAPAPERRYPGMEHFLGFDAPSGRLFHLHVHYQLVLGEKDVKNHRIPLEREFLDSTLELDGVPVPRPELELGVLSVRALLKYRNRDAVKDVLKIRTPGLSGPIRAELDWLLRRTTVEDVRSAMREAGGVVPPDLVGEFLETFERDPRAGATLFALRTRLRRRLAGLQRQGRFHAGLRHRGVTIRRRLRREPPPRMTPERGGTTIAIVGADGSGKSTITGELSRWLSWKLDVRAYYLGSKSPSRRSRWSYVAFRALRRGHRTVSGSLGVDSPVARSLGSARDVALALHYLAIGDDRTRRYREGRSDADAGRIVFFDRFPLTALSRRDDHRLLDGPRIAVVLDGAKGPLIRRMAAAEETTYRRFGVPDHLIVLLVSPHVSAERKPDHAPEILAAKGRAAQELAAIAEASAEGIDLIRVDADRPLDEVLAEVKERVWDVI